jgi:hypothetical protein
MTTLLAMHALGQTTGHRIAIAVWADPCCRHEEWVLTPLLRLESATFSHTNSPSKIYAGEAVTFFCAMIQPLGNSF